MHVVANRLVTFWPISTIDFNVVFCWSLLLLLVDLGLFTDTHLLLVHVVLLPLTEAIGALFKLAQKQDVFINNFVAIIKVC